MTAGRIRLGLWPVAPPISVLFDRGRRSQSAPCLRSGISGWRDGSLYPWRGGAERRRFFCFGNSVWEIRFGRIATARLARISLVGSGLSVWLVCLACLFGLSVWLVCFSILQLPILKVLSQAHSNAIIKAATLPTAIPR
jgi:hypothetical protein